MKVLVNASTCVIGGGIQVASGLINHIERYERRTSSDWCFALSTEVARECDPAFLSELREEGRLVITRRSPGSPLGGRTTRRALEKMCRLSSCERVFTVFGPSYVNFPVPEYMGFADAFAYASTPEAYTWHPFAARVVGRLKKRLKIRSVSKATRYWVEAAHAKTELARALGVEDSRIEVIPNCVNSRIVANLVPHRDPTHPTFLFLAAAYWHKNHMILPDVLRRVRSAKSGNRLTVVTTLHPESPQWLRLSAALAQAGVSDMVDNKGPLAIDSVAAQLGSCTAVLQLSLLETFSSTYVEAMAAGVPLLVSDRSFAHDVCANAALYVEPLDPVAIANQLLRLAEDPTLRENLVARGKARLADFPDAETKNRRLIDFCTQ